MGQSTVIHSRPDAAVAALKPGADAVAGEAVLDREPLICSVRQDVKESVAVVIKPQAAVSVFVPTHAAAGRRAEQTAPLGGRGHPFAPFHFAKPITGQYPE